VRINHHIVSSHGLAPNILISSFRQIDKDTNLFIESLDGADTMNSREPSDLPPTASYPATSAQVNQNAMYYPGRQLTADEILTAELSRDAAGNNLGDGSTNGTFALRSVMTSRGILTKVASQITDQQHNNAFAFPPNQQVGVDPNHDLSYGDQSARRKRSKVSRACDECRRKKVSIGYISL
jgi:hypothetical protein